MTAMTTSVAPIGLAGYTQRINRLQHELVDQRIDALIVGASSDLVYLTGYHAHVSERLNLLIVPATGTPALIVPNLEAPLIGHARDLADIHNWADHDDPAVLAAAALGDVSGRRIAVGNRLFASFLLRIQARVGPATWIEADPVLRTLRMRKDDAEIAIMAEVSRLTDETWEAFTAGPGLTGQTERQAAARLSGLLADRGVTKIWCICASGPHSASPHHATGDRVITRGDAVVFDWGGELLDYQSDVTRTLHVGPPGDEFRRAYDIVREANQATLDAVRPGVPLQDLDRTARRIIGDAGYGDAFIHRVGHGLGIDVHEEPYLVEGNTLPLVEGMVFSDEPGIYLVDRFGVRIEDTVVCTGDGGRRLNEATRDLVVVD